jgi:predicted nucleic acid-binding protein
MRVYLDACCLQRPLDDRSQPRINVEAEAVLTILRLVESGQLKLQSSEVLEFELGQIPDLERRERAAAMLQLASDIVRVNDEIEAVAETFIKQGLRPMDALHVASASAAKTERFCTCDDDLLKKGKLLITGATTVVSPLELISEFVSLDR